MTEDGRQRDRRHERPLDRSRSRPSRQRRQRGRRLLIRADRPQAASARGQSPRRCVCSRTARSRFAQAALRGAFIVSVRFFSVIPCRPARMLAGRQGAVLKEKPAQTANHAAMPHGIAARRCLKPGCVTARFRHLLFAAAVTAAANILRSARNARLMPAAFEPPGILSAIAAAAAAAIACSPVSRGAAAPARHALLCRQEPPHKCGGCGTCAIKHALWRKSRSAESAILLSVSAGCGIRCACALPGCAGSLPLRFLSGGSPSRAQAPPSSAAA